ncbi:MAG: hypothetical protein JW894_11625 [Bacteroidales bacterium]|nr:hypothetical protein [Bacteroidales bacterium]
MKKIIPVAVLLVIISACNKETSEFDCEATVLSRINNGTITCTNDPYKLRFTRGLDIVESIIDSNYQITDSVYL